MKQERKNLQIEFKQIGDAGEFEAVIATLNVIDHDEDIIKPGAFSGEPISIMPAHIHSSVPLGKGRITENGNEAIFSGQFNLEIEAARDWHSALKFDVAKPPAIQEWSFGFLTEKRSNETIEGREVRVLESIKEFEVSPVLLGAGKNTRTVMVKQRFAEQIKETIEDVDALAERAAEILEMRKAKGKSMSADRQAELDVLLEKLENINKSAVALKNLQEDTTDDDTTGDNGEQGDGENDHQPGADEVTPEEQAIIDMAVSNAAAAGIVIPDTDNTGD